MPAHVGEISLEWVCAPKRFMKHKKVVFMGIVYLEYKLSNTRSITACDAVILGAQICICYYVLNLHNLKMSSMNCICTFPQLNTFNFFKLSIKFLCILSFRKRYISKLISCKILNLKLQITTFAHFIWYFIWCQQQGLNFLTH